MALPLVVVVQGFSGAVHGTMASVAVVKAVSSTVHLCTASLICAVQEWWRALFPDGLWKHFVVRFILVEDPILFLVFIPDGLGLALLILTSAPS